MTTFPSARWTCVAAALATITVSVHAQTTLPENMTRRIDSVFAMYNSRTSPGCAVGVARDGQSIFEKGYGMSDFQHDVPISASSIFHVASTRSSSPR